MGNVHTREDLKYYQSLPLNLKIAMSKRRIRDFIREYGESGVCVSVSGKDSSVLLHLVRTEFPNVKGVFVDTGLEYPSVRDCNKQKRNVDIVKPSIDFKTVIEKYGYPIIGKEVASCIGEVRRWLDRQTDRQTDSRIPYGYRVNELIGVDKRENIPDYFRLRMLYGETPRRDGKRSQYDKSKWRFLLDAPFKISGACCNKMKKAPVKKYQKENDMKPMVGTLAQESFLRQSNWLKNGCNVFGENAISKPLSFWTENDILEYIKKYNVYIPSEYGDIVIKNETGIEGQMNVHDFLNNYEQAQYETTGVNRTGCMFCMFGIMQGKDRFTKLNETHGKICDYVLRGGKFDKDGNWIPHNGLGFWFVIKWLNVHGNLGIELPNENEYVEKYGTEETAKHLVADE